jgi:hypothetical protein
MLQRGVWFENTRKDRARRNKKMETLEPEESEGLK